jgi:hypothetical protein
MIAGAIPSTVHKTSDALNVVGNLPRHAMRRPTKKLSYELANHSKAFLENEQCRVTWPDHFTSYLTVTRHQWIHLSLLNSFGRHVYLVAGKASCWPCCASCPARTSSYPGGLPKDHYQIQNYRGNQGVRCSTKISTVCAAGN